MAYDAEMADRVRELIVSEPGLSEQRMFGGLAFLLDGRIAVVIAAHGLLLRVHQAEYPALILRPGAAPFINGKREMRGWLRISDEVLQGASELTFWVSRGVDVAQELGPR